jgi:predicted protein tyrosine phosphatase
MQKRLRASVARLADRLKTQGGVVTLNWLLGHGLPRLMGIPILRYCRVTPQIYVGAQIGAIGKRRLLAQGFTASVNLRREFDDAARGLALTQYCYLPTDDEHAPTLAQLEAGAAFIHAVLESGGKVYIHCHGGIGRAPTLAAAYFMRQGYSLEAALALIRTVRPFIRPTVEQLEQLKRFGGEGRG